MRTYKLFFLGIISLFITQSLFAQVTQQQIRASMEKLYLDGGPNYELYANPTLEILEKVVIEDYERWHVKYYVDEGEYSYAYILIPLNRTEDSKFPVVLCLHPTSESGKNRVVGIYPGPAQKESELAGRENRMYAVHLVKRGFVTIAPDRAGYGERRLLEEGNYEAQQNAFQEYLRTRYSGFSLSGKNVYDLKIALDVVSGLDCVDSENVGVIGHSLGAMDAIMSIAFDSRIKAAVVNSGGMVRLKPEWWNMSSSELINYLNNPVKNHDTNMNLFLMMAAPRSVLYQFSPADSFDWTPNLIEAYRTVDEYYNTFDTSTKKNNFSFYIHGNGHDFVKESRELSYSWLEERLKRKPESNFDKIYHPEAIDIANGYTQGFDRIDNVYPYGWTAWMVTTAQQTGSNPNNNPRVISPSANAPSLQYGTAASTGNFVYNYAGKLGFKNGAYSDYAIVVALNTSSVHDKISVSFDAMTIRNLYDGAENDLINSLCLQYRIGKDGDFKNLGETIRNGNNQQSAGTEPVDLQNFTFELPEECNDKSVVQLRWIAKYISGTLVASNIRPSFAIDNFTVTVDSSSSLSQTLTMNPNTSLEVYPNPTNNIINIKINDVIDKENIIICMYDMQGKEVYNQSHIIDKDSKILTFALTGKFTPGQYIVKAIYRDTFRTAPLQIF